MYFYLLNRRGHYHFRLRVPADLSHVIISHELVKSLKTTEEKQACLTASYYLQRIQKTFSLFRSGYISEEQVRDRIDDVLGRRKNKINFVIASSCTGAQLSSVIAAYISEKERNWTLKTKMENEASFGLLIDIIGDVTIENINRETARQVRELLCILPANVHKRFPEATIPQVLEMIQAGGGHPPMSITTINKHLSRFSSLMGYCVKEAMLKSNPAERMTLKQKRKADEERKPYSPDELKMIIEKLPRTDDEPERYWIPLLGMFTGMRLDELCQLYVEDIKDYQGIPCIHVNDEKDKKLKTLSSNRVVPVHPKLCELGFLEYVKKVREAGCPRLWMNLKRREADGYGSAYGKVFQRFNRKHITADPLKSFHSFRHWYANKMKQQGVQESVIAELMGHANPSVTMGRYGKRYEPKVLLDAIKKLDI